MGVYIGVPLFWETTICFGFKAWGSLAPRGSESMGGVVGEPIIDPDKGLHWGNHESYARNVLAYDPHVLGFYLKP